MRASLLSARAELRAHRGTYLLIAVLVALSFGAVLGGWAGARRTSSVLERFRESSDAADISVSLDTATPDVVERFRALPGIAEVGELAVVLSSPSGSGLDPGAEFIAVAPVDGEVGRSLDRPRLLRGRLPDPARADEVLVDPGFAREQGVEPGDRFVAESMSLEQLMRLFEGEDPGGRLEGPEIELVVTGVGRLTFDPHTAGGARQTFLATPAFVERYRAEVAMFDHLFRVRLESGTTVSAFMRSVRDLTNEVSFETAADEEARISDAVRLSSAALAFFAMVATVASLVVCGTLLTRAIAVSSGDDPTWRAIGADIPVRTLSVALPSLASVLVGAGGALLVGVGSSAWLPFGLARTIEVEPGIAVDGVVSLGGTVGVLVAVGGFVLWRSRWTVRRGPTAAAGTTTPSRIADGLAGRGFPLPVVLGWRLALERGLGLPAPLRTGVAGGLVAAGGVVALIVVGACIDRVVTTPHRFGVPYDFELSPGADADPAAVQRLAEDLASRDDIESVSLALAGSLRVGRDQQDVQAWGVRSVRGDPLMTVVSGRTPSAPDEIALGPESIDDAGVRVGDPIDVTGPSGEREQFRVVGTVLFSSSATEAFARGVALTSVRIQQLEAVQHSSVFVRLKASADLAVAGRQLRREFPLVVQPLRPPQIDNLDEVDVVVPVLIALLTALGVAAVGHSIATGVRRRRRDLAVLAALGFLRRQLRSCVVWSSLLVVSFVLVVGGVLGLGAGRWGWSLLADGLRVQDDPLVPSALIAGVVAISLSAGAGAAAIAARFGGARVTEIRLRSE